MNRSTLSSICRNVPNGNPYHSARLHNFEISTQLLNQLKPVLNDRELFTSADAVFPLIDPEALIKLQRIWRVFQFFVVPHRFNGRRTGRKSPQQHESVFLAREGAIPFVPSGYLRKRSSFRDQLVVRSSLRNLVLKECRDSSVSGGHVAFKATLDKIRDRYWWPTLLIGKGVQSHCRQCVACHHLKTSHRPPKL